MRTISIISYVGILCYVTGAIASEGCSFDVCSVTETEGEGVQIVYETAVRDNFGSIAWDAVFACGDDCHRNEHMSCSAAYKCITTASKNVWVCMNNGCKDTTDKSGDVTGRVDKTWKACPVFTVETGHCPD